MMIEPRRKRTVAFIDGQNLYHAAKAAFSYSYPNYDPELLAQAICKRQGWDLNETRFYTGLPDERDNNFWHHFWTVKLGSLRRRAKVFVYSRIFRYRNRRIALRDGEYSVIRMGSEKGIDIRIAIDIITLARKNKYDVALIFSQDQDLTEAAQTIREIAREKDRWIKVACAYPINEDNRNYLRGIDKTDWLPFDKELYDRCIDYRDYRPFADENATVDEEE